MKENQWYLFLFDKITKKKPTVLTKLEFARDSPRTSDCCLMIKPNKCCQEQQLSPSYQNFYIVFRRNHGCLIYSMYYSHKNKQNSRII